MPSMTLRATALLLLAAAFAAPAAGYAATRVYSYDSASPATQAMTESGLTFVFEKSLLSTRVLKLVETHDIGAADLQPAAESELGRGGLSALIGRAPERDLYEITDQEDGKALKRALCHAPRAFLVFGPIRNGQPLRVYAVTYDAKTRQGKLCVTLDYAFHGEWALPAPIPPQPDRSDPFNDTPNNTMAGGPVITGTPH